eukprot:CAMPEP_0119469158 /NCGR_PEP_ID=MMETSP1344-20130328/2610_1 /TAXON_ID=236787 /ORGANISM="Florenciella parvula, Strain CCMP2471" /LENGTH=71 /DNA_ID=CAMNT_0007501705 /DNA_START=658 /DNA_END=873 /DNA_ORIENTATION=+
MAWHGMASYGILRGVAGVLITGQAVGKRGTELVCHHATVGLAGGELHVSVNAELLLEDIVQLVNKGHVIVA